MALLEFLGLKQKKPTYNAANAGLDLGIGMADPVLRASSNADGSPIHKGLFGQKGTLRDILGLVGDSLLMQGGYGQQYFPKREKEKLSDALTGYDEDPLAAIGRAIGVDPVQGQEFLKGHYQNQKAQAAAGKDLEAVKNQQFGTLGSMAASAVGKPGSWKALYGQAKQYAEARGLPFDLSPDATDEELQAYAQRAMDAKDIFAQRQTAQRDADTAAYREGNLRISQQRANTGDRRTAAYEQATRVGNYTKVAGAHAAAGKAFKTAAQTGEVGKPPKAKAGAAYPTGPIFHQRGTPFQRYSDGSVRYAGPKKEVPSDEED